MELAKTLKQLLPDVVAVYFQAHGYHWNVEGPDFSQYHSLFADIYGDIYDSIDPMAENIRKLGDYSPFILQKLAEATTIKVNGVEPNPKDMAKALLKSNDQLIESLKKAFIVADKENEQGVADFIAGRIDAHQKWSWQLRASTK